MRNPLTVALAAMAVHTAAALALGWPYPSVATFLAGLFGIGWGALAETPPPTGVGALVAVGAFLPCLLPAPVVAAALAAFAAAVVPREADPLRNSAIALPALAFLVLALTF